MAGGMGGGMGGGMEMAGLAGMLGGHHTGGNQMGMKREKLSKVHRLFAKRKMSKKHHHKN